MGVAYNQPYKEFVNGMKENGFKVIKDRPESCAVDMMGRFIGVDRKIIIRYDQDSKYVFMVDVIIETSKTDYELCERLYNTWWAEAHSVYFNDGNEHHQEMTFGGFDGKDKLDGLKRGKYTQTTVWAVNGCGIALILEYGFIRLTYSDSRIVNDF
jgi:hypothetical protein